MRKTISRTNKRLNQLLFHLPRTLVVQYGTLRTVVAALQYSKTRYGVINQVRYGTVHGNSSHGERQ